MAKATITNISDHRPQQPEKPADPTPEDMARLRKRLRLGDEYMNFESPLSDLLNMARLVASCIEDAIGTSDEKLTGDPELYWLPKSERDQMLFAVYHLQNMVQQVVDEWHKPFDEADGSPAT